MLVSKKEWTVSELSFEIKNLLENKFYYLYLKGEITNVNKRAIKGIDHCYFSLKDKDGSSINAVMWKSIFSKCQIEIKDGLEVLVYGKITSWKNNSTYQIQVEKIDKISEEGKLLKIIEEIKERLKKEGLFDVSKKKQVPKFPKEIGLITAETGAALQDILGRLKNRTPIKIKLYSVLVQGKDAPKDIIEAINFFNNLQKKPDLLVITRGGGSIEDLMAFNDENLARAVFNSKIPTISAIGHEIDTPIIDYVSDLRLPTPTSVAEHITLSKEQAYVNLNVLIKRFFKILVNKTLIKYKKIEELIFNFLFKKKEKLLKRKNKIKQLKEKIEFISKLRKSNFKLKISKFFERKKNLREKMSNFLFKKKEKFLRKYNLYNNIKYKIKSFLKFKVNKYKNNLQILKKININNIIKNIFIKHKNRFYINHLKLSNLLKKNVIFVQDLFGNKIFFKSNLKKDDIYILKFVDGEVKIKILD